MIYPMEDIERYINMKFDEFNERMTTELNIQESIDERIPFFKKIAIFRLNDDSIVNLTLDYTIKNGKLDDFFLATAIYDKNLTSLSLNRQDLYTFEKDIDSLKNDINETFNRLFSITLKKVS